VATTIGVDMGGTKMLVVRVENNEVVAQARHAVPDDPAELSSGAIEAVRQLIGDDVEAIGLGVAGLVQWPDGVFVWGPHVAGTRIPMRSDVEAAFGIPVVVDNDANAGAWGELHLGAGRGYRDLLFVTLGTGIGGSIVLDGTIHRGLSFAGEWGHTLFESNGARCGCGKRGCWETAASGPALVRLARTVLAQNPEGPLTHRLRDRELTGEAITAAADAGDETARGLVAQVGADLGRGLCNLIAIFDPEIVIVGGGLGSVGESLLGPARRVAADALHGGSHRMLPPILVAGLGESAGAIGGAMLAEDLVTGRLLLN
jgi:glucokinase